MYLDPKNYFLNLNKQKYSDYCTFMGTAELFYLIIK